MKCLFINNDGAGFADHIDVPDGATVAALFAERLPGRDPDDYLVRVNRLPAAADQPLREGDRVSFTPSKVEGAGAGGRPPRRGRPAAPAARPRAAAAETPASRRRRPRRRGGR